MKSKKIKSRIFSLTENEFLSSSPRISPAKCCFLTDSVRSEPKFSDGRRFSPAHAIYLLILLNLVSDFLFFYSVFGEFPRKPSTFLGFNEERRPKLTGRFGEKQRVVFTGCRTTSRGKTTSSSSSAV